MSHFLLDACALLNLRSGWGSLSELQDFGESWSLGEIALREATFVREFDADGSLRKVVLDPTELVSQGGLQVLRLDSPTEQRSFIEFAAEVDDGEAEALALARHRAHLLLTDDRLALRLASQRSPPISCVETPEILMAWASGNSEREARLPLVIHRITTLAKFHPRKGSAHHAWWQGLLTKSSA